MDPQQGPPQSDPLIGQTVGNYLVTQKLGEGGMGSVYLAEHPTIGKKVALKVLHPEFSTNPEVAERFFTEAKAVNAIGHPNIVDIVDYGVLQGGPQGRDRLVYFIMEYLSGVTLAHAIRTESPLPPERALTIALQVADALAASHKTGIVHRDLKPDNIILMTRGRERDFVKLLDFGIAKLTGGDGLSSHRTRTGLVLGTPAYMSPEQCEGRANVDHRTDIYALGICLYEMLTGRVPFIGEGYGEILVQHLTQKPLAPSSFRMMSPHVEAVVMKALEKRVDLRYPTMDEYMRAMADPVGFVEAHGGVAGFATVQLQPSDEPLPPVRLTPSPLTPLPGMMTPLPGTMTPARGLMSPVPGSLTSSVMASPTTLSSANGEAGATRPRSKMGFVIAGGIVVAAAVVAVIFVASGGKKTAEATGGSGVASGSAVVTGVGSAALVVPDKGSGSAAGSGSVAESGSATGSATGSGSGSATGSGSASATGSATVLPNPMIEIKVTSTPDGAEIFIDGADTGKKTPATLTSPQSKHHETITLRLKGYDDYSFRGIALDQAEVTENAPLKKATPGRVTMPGHGTPGHGKGSAHHDDTGLMRPD